MTWSQSLTSRLPICRAWAVGLSAPSQAAGLIAGSARPTRGRPELGCARDEGDDLVGVAQHLVRTTLAQPLRVPLELDVGRHDADSKHARGPRGDHVVARVAHVDRARGLDGRGEQGHRLGKRKGVRLALTVLCLHPDHDWEELGPLEARQGPPRLRIRPAGDKRHRVPGFCERAERLGAVDDSGLARDEAIPVIALVPLLESRDDRLV
mmetsp:Transcript_39208/g.96880  ORF Transcript_39208/g.96880 Transcript_39208/m.96880 type:complete len:209 (-) Transcript_39208:1297-1923(-)